MSRDRLLLVDGNSMLFRAFYATSYGLILKTSFGAYTNAVFAFANMLSKAIERLKPKYVAVCFDKGKHTFRHDIASDYKAGRKETPIELVSQFELVRDFLKAYPIPYFEFDDIEADDIVGSLSKKYQDIDVAILSSDRDMLQLIDKNVTVYLMKKGLTDIAEMNETSLFAEYELSPKQIIDLKALMGDSSDNIKGVRNVGQKTATKYLKSYGDVETLYEHIDEIKGKAKEYLIEDKEQCFLSKKLATIITDLDLNVELSSLELKRDDNSLNTFFKEYEMHSLIIRTSQKAKEIKYQLVNQISDDIMDDCPFIFFDSNEFSYYERELCGLAFCGNQKIEYITLDNLLKDERTLAFLASDKGKIVYDIKALLHLANYHKFKLNDEGTDDLMLMAFLVNNYLNEYNEIFNYYNLEPLPSCYDLFGTIKKPLNPDLAKRANRASQYAKNCKEVYSLLLEDLKEEELDELYHSLEKPLTKVLYEMECNGIICDEEVLDNIAQETLSKMNEISDRIYQMVGEQFNLNSPKQLAEVLFDKLGLPDLKKRSTSVEILQKLSIHHPIIDELMEYRKYSKLYSTYAEGLKKYIQSDKKIHTIFSQTITQTGRLSSYEPNLQNISVKDEDGKMIRKAFKPSENHILMSSDYSQIELRVLASLSDETNMIEAFNSDIDIHTKTAMDVFHLPFEAVDDHVRRQAKAVNFGVVYGISDFGLSKQVSMSIKDAQRFIEEYFKTYPKIKEYMDYQIAFCTENGYVKTMMNRRRYIKEIAEKNYMVREFGKRAAMNSPIQGSAADLIKLAMINIDKDMKNHKLKSKLILQVHDELIFDVDNSEIEIMKDIIKQGMSNAYELKVQLKSSLAMGQSWYEAK